MSLCLYFLLIFTVNALRTNFADHSILRIVDYDVNSMEPSVTKKTDLRTKFLENKRKYMKTKKRIFALESATAKSIYYSDGIPHYIVNSKMKKWNEIQNMENNFKSMLKMDGVKYEYKRDMHWRTWREVTYPNSSRIIICYRCENIVNTTCETCHGSGSWAIEENVQCPYEILSIKNKNDICAVNYKEINKINEECPTTITMSDLRTCNNPMETKYLVERDFKTASERNTNFCKDRQFCEILTIYEISSNQTIFRIINSSNHVIYSRIMKFGGNNYVCIEDCGFYDPVEKKVSNIEKPFIVDLLDKSHKNKRENLLTKTVIANDTKIVSSTTIPPMKVGVKVIKNPYYESSKKMRDEERQIRRNLGIHASTMSSCKKIQTTTTFYFDEYDVDEYFGGLDWSV